MKKTLLVILLIVVFVSIANAVIGAPTIVSPPLPPMYFIKVVDSSSGTAVPVAEATFNISDSLVGPVPIILTTVKTDSAGTASFRVIHPNKPGRLLTITRPYSCWSFPTATGFGSKSLPLIIDINPAYGTIIL